MTGPRFYDGQPVVCVQKEWPWIVPHPRPVLGQRYVVASSKQDAMTGLWGVSLADHPDPARGVCWGEICFEPITRREVDEILRSALDAPQDLVEDESDRVAEEILR